jgi:K+-transporting ATPase ATPase C chain
MLRHQLRPAVVMTLLVIVVTGLIYPGLVTGLAQLLFPRQANGSLLVRDGRPVGSALIGQSFAAPYYFHPRPSAAGSGYAADSSGATNKGPTDRKLADTLIAQAVDSAVKNDGAIKGQIPSDMVTSSASGLDPDISPANAELQVARVARARHLDAAEVRAVLASHTEGRQFGFFGESRVNVLVVNLALDSAFVRPAGAATPAASPPAVGPAAAPSGAPASPPAAPR